MDKKKKILFYGVAAIGVAVGVYAAYQLLGKKKSSLIAIDPRVGMSINDIKSAEKLQMPGQQRIKDLLMKS